VTAIAATGLLVDPFFRVVAVMGIVAATPVLALA